MKIIHTNTATKINWSVHFTYTHYLKNSVLYLRFKEIMQKYNGTINRQNYIVGKLAAVAMPHWLFLFLDIKM